MTAISGGIPLKIAKKMLQKIFTCQIVSLRSGYDEVAEVLIRNGADVNFVGQYGNTALMGAAQKGKRK